MRSRPKIQFRAQLFNEKSGRRNSGLININDGTIEFLGSATKLVVNISDLVIADSLTSEGLISFSSVSSPGLTIFTDEVEALRVCANNHHSQAGRLFEQFKQDEGKSFAYWVLGAIVVLGAISSLTFSGIAGKILVNLIPRSYEEKLGELIAAKVIRESSQYAKANDSLFKLAGIVTQSIPGSLRIQKILVADDDSVNAMAFPGGIIVVNRGLIEKVKRPEQLLGVLAHEIGHAYYRHSMQELSNMVGSRVLLSLILFRTDSGLGSFVGAGANLGELSFSRSKESESDQFAVEIMTKNGVDPSGLAEFFEILKSEGPGLDGVLKYMSTHPPTPDRISQTKAWIQKIHQSFKPLDFDLNRLKQEVSK